MKRFVSAVIWLIAPGFAIWKRSGSSQPLPCKPLLVQSATRIAIVGFLVWFASQSQWWPAAVLAAALTAMTFFNVFAAEKIKIGSKQ